MAASALTAAVTTASALVALLISLLKPVVITDVDAARVIASLVRLVCMTAIAADLAADSEANPVVKVDSAPSARDFSVTTAALLLDSANVARVTSLDIFEALLASARSNSTSN